MRLWRIGPGLLGDSTDPNDQSRVSLPCVVVAKSSRDSVPFAIEYPEIVLSVERKNDFDIKIFVAHVVYQGKFGRLIRSLTDQIEICSTLALCINGFN